MDSMRSSRTHVGKVGHFMKFQNILTNYKVLYSNPPIDLALRGKAKMHGILGDPVNRGSTIWDLKLHLFLNVSKVLLVRLSLMILTLRKTVFIPTT